ncbi:MAG: hypothetical protein K2K55_06435, partial [Duncaniella sp.]|nr:hypothetical protein [Duncaniella sp.]
GNRIATLIISDADAVYDPWTTGKKLNFASSCTVYVPDNLVNDFKRHPSWKIFKEIKPLSKL